MATGMAGAGVASDFANRYRRDAAPIAARSLHRPASPSQLSRGFSLPHTLLVTSARLCDKEMSRMRPAA